VTDLPKFVVTGCAHSGTGWLAAALTAAGIPTGHEQWFSLDGDYSWDPGLAGDVAWTAVPFLDQIPESIATVRIVRDPWLIAESIHREGWLDAPSQSPAGRFVLEHAPEVFEASPGSDRPCSYVFNWLTRTQDLPTFHLWHLTNSTETFQSLTNCLVGEYASYAQAIAALSVERQGHKVGSPDREPFNPSPLWAEALDEIEESI